MSQPYRLTHKKIDFLFLITKKYTTSQQLSTSPLGKESVNLFKIN